MAIDDNSQIAAVGAIGTQGAQQMEVAYATKMQAILHQPMVDVTTKLCNEDFAGDFFKIGDSVTITKPDPKSVKFEIGKIDDGEILAGNTGNVGTNGAAKDARIKGQYAKFTKNILTIDKYAKYAFAVSKLTAAEERWNEENGNLALAAHQLRIGHNLLTMNTLIADANVTKLGTAAAPIEIHNPDDLMKKVIMAGRTKLKVAGAIDATGKVTYGTNAMQGIYEAGALFVPEELYNQLLLSNFITLSRGTELADKRVEGKDVERVLGLDLAIEPALDPTNEDLEDKVTVADAVEGTMVVLMGTRNAVTRAAKVLPPDKFVSHDRYADEFHGLEIFGEKVIEPKACVVAFVKKAADYVDTPVVVTKAQA